jgi:hypothetical protein
VDALADTYERLGGRANFGYLGSDGTLAVYAANATNHVWTFEMDGARAAATALHSDDRSVFRMVFGRAEGAELVQGPALVAGALNG